MLTIGDAPHALGYVLAAATVCLFASWAAFGAVRTAPADRRLGAARMAIVAASVGFGVWSTHFIAMLGLRPDFALGFSAPETFGSMALSLALVGGGLILATRARSRAGELTLGGASGLGVSAMHHVGMLGLSGCVVSFEPLATGAATIAAAAAGAAAMAVARAPLRFPATGAAAVFSLGVVSLHFGSIAGTGFAPGPVRPFEISSDALSVLQIVASLVILLPFGVFARRALAKAREARLAGEVALATGEGVVTMDRDGRLTWANKAFLKMHGVALSDALGVSGVSVVRRLADKTDAALFAEAVERGRAAHIELQAMSPSGRGVWQEVRLIPRRREDRKLTGFVSAHRDITVEKTALEKLKRSEAEASRLALVAEHANDAILIADAEGRTTWVNPAFVRLTGYDLDSVAGRRPGELLQGPDTDREAAAALSRAVRERRPARTEILNYSRDGAPYWIELEISPVERQGEPLCFVAVSRDVTDRVRREERLVEARRQAEKADRMKSEFLARMSHEIRTPMNGVTGLAELLTTTELDETQRLFVGELRKSSDRLLRVVDDILDFSAIEEGRIALRPAEFDLRALAEETAALIAPEAAAKGLSFGFTVAKGVASRHVGDDGRLRQVLLNLLSNAVKFTETGRVELAVSRLAALDLEGRRSERLSFEVSDTGVGIP
ncbi:MAG: PAS domain S-box protein, partial [Pseudomonadota bacterium]